LSFKQKEFYRVPIFPKIKTLTVHHRVTKNKDTITIFYFTTNLLANGVL